MNTTTTHDELWFADENPTPVHFVKNGGWKIMIVDDDDFVHKVTELTLGNYRYEDQPVEYLHAYSAAEARTLLAQHPDTAVILLDVVMETENAGLEFARYVRTEAQNAFVRIILRTGQPGQAPERTVITEYDINDYRHKAELSEQRLFTSLTAALRSYRDLRTIENSRFGLQGIVGATGSLFGITSMDAFLPAALEHLLETGRCRTDSAHEYGLVALIEDQDVTLCATQGPTPPINDALRSRIQAARTSAVQHQSQITDQEFVACFTNQHTHQEYFFFIQFFHQLSDLEKDLLHILGGNIGVALHNLFLNEEIIATQREVVLTLGEVVETRSKETAQHVKRVAEYSYVLALHSGLAEDEAQLLRMASPMHDVGKIGIPDSILFKPGKLTEDEFAIIKTHTVIGHGILKNSSRRILRAAATIALQHHEHWDGRGYPHGLRGEEAHIFARITALADVFDALASDRVYKKAWPLEEVFTYVQEKRGQQFDPHLVDIFLAHRDTMIAIRDMYPDELPEI
ncbi:DUF3369 domain-containing protein [Desulfovibrionales bacterium]